MGVTTIPLCAIAGIVCLLFFNQISLVQVEAFCSTYVEPEGYSCQEYKMYTEDGYGLLMHRVGATGRKQSISSSSKTELSPSFKQTVGIPVLTRPNLLPVKMDLAPTSVVEGSLKPELLPCTLTSSCQITSVQGSNPAQTPITTGDHRYVSSLSISPAASLITAEASPRTISFGLLSSPTSLNVPVTRGLGLGQDVNRARKSPRGDPVLLLHPEMLNGDSWFKHSDLENKTALLPFVLADEGFDVWIGHGRATLWSHDHVAVTHNDEAYWNWTWDQLAGHDVPTMLRTIKSETNGKIHVIGVSQSATVAAAAATRPHNADLMNSLTLVGPTIFRGRRNPLVVRTWTELFERLLTDSMPDTLPDASAASPGQFNISREFNMESLSLRGPVLRSDLWYSISARSRLRWSKDLSFPVMVPGRSIRAEGPDCCLSASLSLFDNNGWDGTTSARNVEHVEQALVTNTWRKFDHGSAELNYGAFGQPTPPFYEPRDIPVDLPVLVVHGGQDFYAPPDGVMEFLAMMQNIPARVFLPSYAHFDLFFSERRNEDVYDPICEFLKSNGSD